MVLKDIIAVSGEAGLFKFVAQGKNSIIIEHLESKKGVVPSVPQKVSSLDEIAIFTEGEDLALSKVFDLIFDKENGGPAIDYKSDPEKLKAYFESVLPSYDKNKVYVSDIKKLLNWYNILQKLGMLVKEEPEKPAEEVVEESEVKEKEKVKKSASKSSAGEEKQEKPSKKKQPKSGTAS